MITWFARNFSRLSVAFITVLMLTACGGGGGSGSPSFLPDSSGSGGGSSDYKISIELLDADGNPTNTVSSASSATMTITVTKGKNPAEDIIVSVIGDIGLIAPASGLTDANGVTTFTVEAGEILGAGTITASINVEGELASLSTNFRVSRPNYRLGFFEDGLFFEGEMSITPDQLSAGGASLLSMALVDDNDERAQTTEIISLRSSCSLDGDAVLPETITTSSGQITATYTAAGCEGDDVITASLVDGDTTAKGTVNVAPAEVGSINFVSATPELIALKGTGGPGRQETASVSFLAVDGQGFPISGIQVNFELSTEIGGLSLSEPSSFTGVDGVVVAIVRSGNVATPVRVIATVDVQGGQSRSTISDALVVSTGLPDANSISLSTSSLNVGGAGDVDGVTATITVRMADKFNNPVADGTSALFTTEYGSIESTCTTIGGVCTVTWSSQAPRTPTFNQDLVRQITGSGYNCPSHSGGSGPCPDDLGEIRGLRSAITVTAIGEEFFIDTNGNGLYDDGEAFNNLPEAFTDNNEDGVYTPALGPQCGPPSTAARCTAGGAEETFVDFNEDGQYSLNVNPPGFPNGMYNGSLCPPEGEGIFCSKELVVVSDSLDIIMSSRSNFFVTVARLSNGQVSNSFTEGVTYVAYVSDRYNNSPAGASSVSVSTLGDCTIDNTETNFGIFDSNARGAFSTGAIRVRGGGCPGTLTLAVNPTGGSPTRISYACNTTVNDPNNPPMCN